MAQQTVATQDPVALNQYVRNVILANAQPIWLKIGSYTQQQNPYTAGQPITLNIAPQFVGLIRKFIIMASFTVAQGAAETQNATIFGGANAISNITFTDTNNLARTNTAGWHLNYVATARRQLAAAAAFTSDNPNGIGSNYNIQSTPAVVTTPTTLYQTFEVPLAYADNDLRGGMFAGVTNATSNLQITINPNFFVSNTGNPVQAVYQSTSAQLGKITAYQIDVYQETLDQLPRDQTNQPLLPQLDMSTLYQLINTTQTGMAVNSDYSIPFSNLRQFLSTFLVYDNGGVLNAGTDVNTISLSAANSFNIFRLPPRMLQLINGRWKINDDWPKGVYYIHSRDRPISTVNYGNLALNFNASLVNPNAQLLVGYESMTMTSQLQAAGSFAAT